MKTGQRFLGGVSGEFAMAPSSMPVPIEQGQIQRRNNALTRGLIQGALAGVAATWVMGKVTTYLYDHEDKTARQQEDDAGGGKTAYGVAAEKAASIADVSLSDAERKKLGSAIHWVLGAGAGALYGAIKRDSADISPLRGLGFGTMFWAVMDETVTPALGLTPGPKAFPLETHARGLAGHLVFGASVDAALAIMNART